MQFTPIKTVLISLRFHQQMEPHAGKTKNSQVVPASYRFNKSLEIFADADKLNILPEIPAAFAVFLP